MFKKTANTSNKKSNIKYVELFFDKLFGFGQSYVFFEVKSGKFKVLNDDNSNEVNIRKLIYWHKIG